MKASVFQDCISVQSLFLSVRSSIFEHYMHAARIKNWVITAMVFLLVLSCGSNRDLPANKSYGGSWQPASREIGSLHSPANNSGVNIPVAIDNNQNVKVIPGLPAFFPQDQRFPVPGKLFPKSLIRSLPPDSTSGAGQTAPATPKPEPFGLVSFIAAILSFGLIAVGLYPFTILLAIAGIVFGLISKRIFRQKPGQYKWKGFSSWGLALSIISTILQIGLFLLILAVLATVLTSC